MSIIRMFCEVLIKGFIGLFVGAGVGALTFGYFCYQNPQISNFRHEVPVAEVCLGVGAGLLTFAATLILLFFSPLARRPLFIWFKDDRTRSPDGPPSQTGG